MSLAGNAAYRLHKAMLKVGINSSVLICMPTISREKVYTIDKNIVYYIRKVANYLLRKVFDNSSKKLLPGSYFYSSLPLISKNIAKNKFIQKADVIYIHSINGGFLGLKDFEELAQTGKKIIFFMHDMWTFTGGCHHSFDCIQYQTGCSSCPMFNNKMRYSSKQNAQKEKLFNKYPNLIFISPSRWMYDCALKSTILAKKEVFVIPNVVDESVFKPLETKVAKEILNLPLDKKIITFGCQAGTKNKFKGWDYLKDAINSLNEEDLELLIYGSDYNQETENELKYPVHFLGTITEEIVLSLICNATDVFVSPSLAESFGLTLLENTLCGTPIVAFDCTAIPEMVKMNPHGFLARYKDSESLANCIRKALTVEKTKSFLDYSSEGIVNKHLELLNKI